MVLILYLKLINFKIYYFFILFVLHIGQNHFPLGLVVILTHSKMLYIFLWSQYYIGICNCSFQYATPSQPNSPTRESASTLPLATILVGFVGLESTLTKDGVFLISGSQPDLLDGFTTPKNCFVWNIFRVLLWVMLITQNLHTNSQVCLANRTLSSEPFHLTQNRLLICQCCASVVELSSQCFASEGDNYTTRESLPQYIPSTSARLKKIKLAFKVLLIVLKWNHLMNNSSVIIVNS
ncbi:hypothetical protein AGLY_009866 [Aphis glycines]|uniref:Uncharacterized protein n=1 Tax=Aphis glycines TaxID=307491 RepID=A0A6G0TIC7_APHGL|nr:hypothetical protein AGLY_009866 [Aphis glycines]